MYTRREFSYFCIVSMDLEFQIKQYEKENVELSVMLFSEY